MQIRRFVKSYKKFSAPIKRLEAVACDAELQEKPLPELKKLAELLHNRCKEYMTEQTKDTSESSQEDPKGKKKIRGTSFKIGGVSVNAKTLLQCEEELEPLDAILSNEENFKNWTFDMKTKSAHFDVEWGADEDTKLLKGIYIYGLGSWEQIKLDPSLEIGNQILLNEDKKPQAKHLLSRAEYLLKVLKKNIEQKKGVQKPKRQRKAKETKALTKEIIENDGSSNDECHTPSTPSTPASVAVIVTPPPSTSKKSPKPKKEKEKEDKDKDGDSPVSSSDKKEKKKEKPKKQMSGPMHFSTKETVALTVLGDLNPSIFNECKEKMRPVKKALKALDNPDQSLSEQEQVQHTRECLLQIGEQINVCLSQYTDPEKIKEWRRYVVSHNIRVIFILKKIFFSNLWYFVSKFTEFDATKLYKLYKKAHKKAEKSEKKEKGASTGKEKTKEAKEKRKEAREQKKEAKEQKREAKEQYKEAKELAKRESKEKVKSEPTESKELKRKHESDSEKEHKKHQPEK